MGEEQVSQKGTESQVRRQEVEPMQCALLLLMNSQAPKVGKGGFYVSDNKRIPPCAYKKIVPNHLKGKLKLP